MLSAQSLSSETKPLESGTCLVVIKSLGIRLLSSAADNVVTESVTPLAFEQRAKQGVLVEVEVEIDKNESNAGTSN